MGANNDKPNLASDKKHFTVLTYGNGPGRRTKQKDISKLNIAAVSQKNYTYQSVVPMKRSTHSSEDVIALASGPMAHLIHGVHEQSYLAHVMMYASCVGDNISHCYSVKKSNLQGGEEDIDP